MSNNVAGPKSLSCVHPPFALYRQLGAYRRSLCLSYGARSYQDPVMGAPNLRTGDGTYGCAA
jgi:hypothetical protein